MPGFWNLQNEVDSWEKSMLPTDKQARKERPVARGVLDYFPDAIAAVANVSYVGNTQHNPGEEMHWAREKSKDNADCIARHLMERGTLDDDGLRHSAKVAWRALAMLQLELEAAQNLDFDDSNISVGGLAVELGFYKAPKFDHDHPPVGYAHCTRESGHTGPCALPFDHTPDLAEHTHKANQWLEGQAKKAEMLKAELKNAHNPNWGMQVYISGPMRGYADNNFEAFDQAEARLRNVGYYIINPANMDRADKEPKTQIDYAKRDTEALNRCTHIAMLPGWERSRGALAEFFYARWIGLKALDAETGEPLDTYSRHDICLAMNQYLNGMEAE